MKSHRILIMVIVLLDIGYCCGLQPADIYDANTFCFSYT